MKKIINFKNNNINYCLIKTNKYKTINVNITISKKLKKEEMTYYSLLNRVINSSCEKYPTKNALSNAMYELYDSYACMNVVFMYETVNITFQASLINQKYINNENLFKKSVDLLKEIMLHPLLENDGFNIKNFNEAKKGLEIDIKNIYNNKTRYAYSQFLKHIYPNSILSESGLGNIEVLKTITPKSLYEFYKNIFIDAMINIGVIGDVEKDEIIDNFNDLNIINNNIELFYQQQNVEYKENVQIIKEEDDIFQTRLIMGFKHNVKYYDNFYYPLLVFDAMFGGMIGSTLFINIREQNSLAYDISSSFSIGKNLFIISCGINKSKIDIVSDIVIKELEKYKNGEFQIDLLEKAKKFIINDLKTMDDYPISILSFYLDTFISSRPSYEDTIKGIESVNKEDIINLCKNIKLDTIYALMPGDDNE